MSVPYEKDNAEKFYIAVHKWSRSIKESHDVFDSEADKQRRPGSVDGVKRPFGPRPFSILRLIDLKNSSKHYFAVSNMHVAEPGAFGRIKVAYPMHLVDKRGRIDFWQPTALKIFADKGKALVPHASAQEYLKGYVPGFYQTFRDGSNKFYYTMPLANGECFIDYINSPQKTFSLPRFFSSMIRAAKEVNAVHLRGYVHHDVKPDNFVIYEKHGRMKVTLVDLDSPARIGEKISIVGTPQYMHPDVTIADKKDVVADPQHDVYSFITMLNLLVPYITTQRAFDVNRISRLFDALLSQQPSMPLVIEKLQQLARIMHTPLFFDTEDTTPWKLKQQYLSYRYIDAKSYEEPRPSTPPIPLSPSKAQNAPVTKPIIGRRVHFADNAISTAHKLYPRSPRKCPKLSALNISPDEFDLLSENYAQHPGGGKWRYNGIPS